jgi:hypothetical protein
MGEQDYGSWMTPFDATDAPTAPVLAPGDEGRMLWAGPTWAGITSTVGNAATSAWSGVSSFASTGSGMAGMGYGAEALASLAQGLLAAKRAKRIAEYNADITEANAQAQAQAAEVEAQQYIRRAALTQRELAEAEVLTQQAQAYREARQQEQDARILGQTRAIIGSSGLMQGGSPWAVYEETARQQALDVLATRYQSALQLRQQRQAAQDQITQDEYAAQLARYGAGERLRVGGAQAGLLRAEADGSAVGAGLLRASAAVTKGAAAYTLLEERRKSPTLLKD